MPRLEKILLGLFMCGALLLFGWYNVSKPSILVLHSYDPDYAWVRDINVGLNRVLDRKYLYQVRWYYMDTKRHPSAAFKASAGVAARNVIATARPDVVIAIDDDAQQYAARHFANDARIKIVFAGVNRDAADYGYGRAANVTGVLERIPLAAMREALRSAANFQALSRPLRIAFIGDRSETVGGDAGQVRRYAWAPLELGTVLQVDTWAEWQAGVRALSATHDVVLVSGYRGLRRGADSAPVPAPEVVAWTEAHSAAPVVSFNGFYIEDGGMLAIGSSPYEQGEVAGRMALQIVLGHRAPASLPVAASRQFIVTMNGASMRARRFELPLVYEAAARTGNQYLP
ncbi:ABC transporter substrate-binding protein [Burkholderia sp. LMU1-1-1.1]|uniref:ABC transporter substrate-binding protein n=1 Tax=Burkholderia sp. LMU1-1-1.1 TaxID=3135266 RepID=UPI003421F5E7